MTELEKMINDAMLKEEKKDKNFDPTLSYEKALIRKNLAKTNTDRFFSIDFDGAYSRVVNENYMKCYDCGRFARIEKMKKIEERFYCPNCAPRAEEDHEAFLNFMFYDMNKRH